MTDREIIQHYRQGNTDAAMSGFLSAYSERLYWLLRRYVPTHEDADDLLQDTLVKLWKGFAQFREDSSIYTWAYRVATNEALNFLRKHRLRLSLRREDAPELLSRQIDDDPGFDGTALQKELYKAIRALPPRQQSVFMMRYLDQMPYNDIARILGTSEGSLKASYHHAYKKVKEQLEKSFNF